MRRRASLDPSRGGYWEFRNSLMYGRTVRRLSAKGRALNRARAILKKACPEGFAIYRSSINPGGIAVDGEASAFYVRPGTAEENYPPSVFVYASLSGSGRGYVRRETDPHHNGHRCMGRNLEIAVRAGGAFPAIGDVLARILEASKQSEGCHGTADARGSWSLCAQCGGPIGSIETQHNGARFCQTCSERFPLKTGGR